MIRTSTLRSGFTLVEILVVLVIIGLMGAMVLAAVRGVTNTARASRTRTIIAACDSVIQEQYESYKYRPFPVEIPKLRQALGTGELGRELLANEAARARLVMLRDLQRMEMPDRLIDFLSPATPAASVVTAAASPVMLDGANNVVGMRDSRTARTSLNVVHNASPKVSSYRDRYNAALARTPAPTAAALRANEGAECLYMIMANSFVGGSPGISTIPSSNIGDTDGDGLPEILDGWGVPIGFIRWPVGYADPSGTLDPGIPDDFDMFRVDFAYAEPHGSGPAKTSDAINVNNSNASVKPWALSPLIISAGGDGSFGIALEPYLDATAGPPASSVAYTDTTYSIPTNAAGAAIGRGFMGVEFDGRSAINPYQYPDPYLRRFREENPNCAFPGQSLTGTDAAEFRLDNISNISMRAEQ